MPFGNSTVFPYRKSALEEALGFLLGIIIVLGINLLWIAALVWLGVSMLRWLGVGL